MWIDIYIQIKKFEKNKMKCNLDFTFLLGIGGCTIFEISFSNLVKCQNRPLTVSLGRLSDKVGFYD